MHRRKSCRWLWISIAVLISAFAMAHPVQDALPSNQNNWKLNWELLDLAEMRRSAAPGAPYNFYDSACSNAELLFNESKQPHSISNQLSDVDWLISNASPRNGHLITVLLPGAIEHWWHKLGGKASTQISVAQHEAHHWVNDLLKECHGGKPSYLLDGKLHVVERAPGLSRPYAKVAELLEGNGVLSTNISNLYIGNGGLAPGNDFYVLLDEWSAYLSASELEFSLLSRSQGMPVFRERVARAESSLNGALHFKAFAITYLMGKSSDKLQKCPVELNNAAQLKAFLDHLLRATDERGLQWATIDSNLRGIAEVDKSITILIESTGMKEAESTLRRCLR